MAEKPKQYGLIVIGAGSGGLVAAELAAKFGAHVALVEASQELGGECLHAGCVPSKALIHVARTFWTAGHSQNVGVHTDPRLDFDMVKQHINASIKTIADAHDNDAYYQKMGVDVIHGRARFIDKNTIEAGGSVLRAKRFIIATGSQPAIPNVKGLTDGPFLTNETIFDLSDLPKSMVIIGGGPIGCELGQAFAMLGSQVTILQSAPRLLPRDEVDASAMLLETLRTMGVSVRLESKIQQVTYDQQAVTIHLEDGTDVTAEKLLLATGRKTTLPGDIEKAGVHTGDRGIIVDERMRTSNKHIYAVGDCNGLMQFTHAAGQQAIIAVENALLGLRKTFDSKQIPWTTFTTPEIAHSGAIKADLDAGHVSYKPIRIDYHEIDKAVAEGETGYIEIVLDEKSTILGATVVGVNAAEILAQITAYTSWKSLTKTIQAYPTYATGLRQGAATAALDAFLGSFSGSVIKQYVKLKAR